MRVVDSKYYNLYSFICDDISCICLQIKGIYVKKVIKTTSNRQSKENVEDILTINL